MYHVYGMYGYVFMYPCMHILSYGYMYACACKCIHTWDTLYTHTVFIQIKAGFI